MPNKKPLSDSERVRRDIDILARTIYGEARGEPIAGKEAVACVILNRVKRARLRGAYWWGNDIPSVCQKPYQFSCWNPSDPNRERIEKVRPDNRVFQSCIKVAERAVKGEISDSTDGSTHYHTTKVSPPWSKSKAPTAQVGGHLFFNNIE